MKPAKSGTIKRKNAVVRDAINKLPRLTTFFQATQYNRSAGTENYLSKPDLY